MVGREIQYAIEVKEALLSAADHKEDMAVEEFLFGSLIGIVLANNEITGKELTVPECWDLIKRFAIKGLSKG